MKTAAIAKCACHYCNERIEFDAERTGEAVSCPHCGMDTTLYRPIPPPPRIEKSPRTPWTAAEKWFWYPLIVVGAFLVFGTIVMALGTNKRDWVMSIFSSLWAGIVIFGAWSIYMVPSLLGQHKRNAHAILVLNLFAGWTFIGWVVALVWAFTVERSDTDRSDTT